MGYYIFSYAVEPTKLQNMLGCKDADVYKEIMQTETFQLYAEQDFVGSVSTKNALRQLIFGEPYVYSSGHSYWYAFIALTDYVGEKLPSTHDIKLSYETDLINEYLDADFGIKIVIEEVLINEQTPFNLPKVADWPLAGLLDKPALKTLLSQLEGIVISDELIESFAEEDEEKEMAYDSIRQIQDNVSFCLSNDLAMLSFCH